MLVTQNLLKYKLVTASVPGFKNPRGTQVQGCTPEPHRSRDQSGMLPSSDNLYLPLTPRLLPLECGQALEGMLLYK